MGYENDSYRDEDGKQLMDFDEDIQSGRDEPQQHLLDDIDDSLHESHERSPTPVDNYSKTKFQKRRRKKSSSRDSSPGDLGDDDDGDVGRDDDMVGLVRDDYLDGGKRKREKGEKRKITEKTRGTKGRRSLR